MKVKRQSDKVFDKYPEDNGKLFYAEFCYPCWRYFLSVFFFLPFHHLKNGLLSSENKGSVVKSGLENGLANGKIL